MAGLTSLMAIRPPHRGHGMRNAGNFEAVVVARFTTGSHFDERMSGMRGPAQCLHLVENVRDQSQEISQRGGRAI